MVELNDLIITATKEAEGWRRRVNYLKAYRTFIATLKNATTVEIQIVDREPVQVKKPLVDTVYVGTMRNYDIPRLKRDIELYSMVTGKQPSWGQRLMIQLKIINEGDREFEYIIMEEIYRLE